MVDQERDETEQAEQTVRNEISGTVRGSAVQVGRVTGGVHHHQHSEAFGKARIYQVGRDVHIHAVSAQSGRVGWWISAGAVCVLMLASVAVLVVLVGQKGMGVGWWPSILVLGLGVAGLLVVVWMIRRGRGEFPSDVSDVAVAYLRTQVRDQWRVEQGIRGLAQPRPLRLRW